MAVDLLWLAFFALLVPVLAEYGKIKGLAKPLGFIAGSGLFFLLAAGFETSLWMMYAAAYGPLGSALFQFLGWILLLVGALWGVVTLLQNK
ncbi:MAG: hypothetical protein JW716_05000 [Candidatus Aenigmarchaeota archaeon]|nr:hypothetical protein [Candidatus Aenigmarchaeota archaeon]